MDPATAQNTGNGVIGNQTTSQSSTSAPPQSAVPSLLDKINSHQFDGVTTQLNGVAPQQPQNQTVQTTKSTQLPQSPQPSQNQQIRGNAFSQLPPSQQSTLPITPSPIPQTPPVQKTVLNIPIQTQPNLPVSEIVTSQIPVQQPNLQPQQNIQNAVLNISPTPPQPVSVQIEYPGEITQQQVGQQAVKSATEITLPTLAETQPIQQNSTVLQTNQITTPQVQQTQPIIQSTPLTQTIPQFGSPFASIQQAVIPPLKPVVQQTQDQSTISSPLSNIQPLAQTIPAIPVQSFQNPQTEIPLQSTEVQANSQPGSIVEDNMGRYEKKKTVTFVFRLLQSLITASLTIQGLRGLYSSIHFILVEFPVFEAALNEHQLGEETVNTFAIKAGMMIFSTAVSLFFAVQMALFKNKTVKVINIVVGILVTIISIVVMHYAQNIHILDVLPTLL